MTFDLDFWSWVDLDPGQDGIHKVKVVSLVDEPFYISQAYTSKRRILIEVLPVPNAYTKSGDQAMFWSAHRRISAHFPRISDPSEISTNLLK